MPHSMNQTKDGVIANRPATMALPSATAMDLSTDELAIIFGCLGPEDIMRARCCKKWSEAAKRTIVHPLAEFVVNSENRYNAMEAMTRALPNLQQVTLLGLDETETRYLDGEDAEDDLQFDDDLDINIISRFTKLKHLKIWNAPLNGIYPTLFHFRHLESLTIGFLQKMKWDLEMLAGLPNLRELDCNFHDGVSGNIKSLEAIKNTLENVSLFSCSNVEGNFMDLAKFPHLLLLSLLETSVTGDIRDISDNDFTVIREMQLPATVYGGFGHTFQHISEVPAFMDEIYCIEKIKPPVLDGCDWYLSENSPDHYDMTVSDDVDDETPEPPFDVSLVHAGSRLGWRWSWKGDFINAAPGEPNFEHVSCEVNWLDPEPKKDSSDYELYSQELKQIEKEINFFKGFHEPPTAERYKQLCREHKRKRRRQTYLIN